MNNAVKIIIKSIVFIVCLGLIIVGQKNISLTGLAMELIGLVGLLVLLFLYNKKISIEKRGAAYCATPLLCLQMKIRT